MKMLTFPVAGRPGRLRSPCLFTGVCCVGIDVGDAGSAFVEAWVATLLLVGNTDAAGGAPGGVAGVESDSWRNRSSTDIWPSSTTCPCTVALEIDVTTLPVGRCCSTALLGSNFPCGAARASEHAAVAKINQVTFMLRVYLKSPQPASRARVARPRAPSHTGWSPRRAFFAASRRTIS